MSSTNNQPWTLPSGAARPAANAPMPELAYPSSPTNGGFPANFDTPRLNEKRVAEDLDPDETYELTLKRIASLDLEISYLDELIDRLRQKRIAAVSSRSNDIAAFCTIIEQEKTLQLTLAALLEQQDTLRWRSLGAQASIGMSPSAMERLLEIQKETGTATGALAAFGAGLSISTLYSATRGDMWWFFVSWWCFIVSLAITGALGVFTAGNDPATTRATRKNWILRRLSVILIGMSYVAVIMGLASFCVAVVAYNVGPELRGGDPVITDGPDLTEFGGHSRKGASAVAYAIIGVIASAYFAAYFVRLGLLIRFKNRSKRNERAHTLAASHKPHRTPTEVALGV